MYIRGGGTKNSALWGHNQSTNALYQGVELRQLNQAGRGMPYVDLPAEVALQYLSRLRGSFMADTCSSDGANRVRSRAADTSRMRIRGACARSTGRSM